MQFLFNLATWTSSHLYPWISPFLLTPHLTFFFPGTRQALAFMAYMNAMSRREISTVKTSMTKQRTSDKPRRYILMPAKVWPTPLSQSTTEKEKPRWGLWSHLPLTCRHTRQGLLRCEKISAWPGAITGRASAGTKTTGGELLHGMSAAPCLGEGLKDIIGAQQQWGCRKREVRWPPSLPPGRRAAPACSHLTPRGHHESYPATKDLPPGQDYFPEE